MRFIPPASTALACAALVAVGAAGQASAAAPANYVVVDSGVYTIANGQISGELPPGATLKTLAADPDDPTHQGLIKSAKPKNLRSADGRDNVAGVVTPFASYNDGCVTLFVNGAGAAGMAYKGQMAGCRRGNLYLHTYVRSGGNGPIIHDGAENECAGTTECSVPVDYYKGTAPVITFAAHGRNRTTGGDSTAWVTMGSIG